MNIGSDLHSQPSVLGEVRAPIQAERVNWRGHSLERGQAERILADYRKEANLAHDFGNMDAFDEITALVGELRAALDGELV